MGIVPIILLATKRFISHANSLHSSRFPGRLVGLRSLFVLAPEGGTTWSRKFTGQVISARRSIRLSYCPWADEQSRYVQDQDLGVNREAGLSIKPGAASPRINFSIRIHRLRRICGLTSNRALLKTIRRHKRHIRSATKGTNLIHKSFCVFVLLVAKTAEQVVNRQGVQYAECLFNDSTRVRSSER